MSLTLDASVFIKWLLQDPQREPETAQATLLVQEVVDGRVAVRQPAHWLVEVAAVLSRVSPERAAEDVAMLAALELPVEDDTAQLELACDLSIRLEHHLFDTLYHAIALLGTDGLLVTADERYFRKASGLGNIATLQSWAERIE